jgi:hypothetical protein
MELSRAQENWSHILFLAKQAAAENFPDAMEYVLRAKLVGLKLYQEHKEMGYVLKNINELNQLEKELERRLNERRTKNSEQDTGCQSV